MISDFVIYGKTDTEQFPCKGEIDSPVELLVKWVGRFPLLAWILAGLFASGVWIGIRCLIGIVVADPMSEAFISGMAFVLFLFSLWLILTRL
jgi:hypothetical protein